MISYLAIPIIYLSLVHTSKNLKDFMMLKQILFSLFTISLSSATLASANCTHYPENERIPAVQFQQNLEKQGYKIQSFDNDDNCYEIEGINPKGKRVEVKFDMKTGEIVRSKHERDDD